MMQVFRNVEELADWLDRGSAITIGNYDGIHRGHLELIHRLEAEAAKKQLRSILITFEPHPQAILAPDNPPAILTTLDEKVAILREHSELDSMLVIEFNRSLAQIKALDFLREWLLNHAFGHRREGNLQFLQMHQKSLGYELIAVEPVKNSDKVVNSSLIRELLKSADVEKARELLGHDLEFSGTVVHGKGQGREQGYPTINVKLPDNKIVLPSGVYAAYTIVRPEFRSEASGDAAAERYYGMMYIGEDKQGFDLEVNLFDFSGDLYRKTVSVFPVAYTRPSIRFESTEKLVEQIGRDEKEIKSMFNLI